MSKPELPKEIDIRHILERLEIPFDRYESYLQSLSLGFHNMPSQWIISDQDHSCMRLPEAVPFVHSVTA